MLLSCLRSRSYGAAGIAVLIALGGLVVCADNGYYMELSVGFRPRLIFTADVLTVAVACSLSAIGAPQLWVFESSQRRLLVRLVSAMLVPGLVALFSVSELVLQGLRIVPAVDGLGWACLTNGLFFGSLSTLIALRYRRHVAPIVGTGAYLLGMIGQALTMPIPVPVEGASGVALLISGVLFATATVLSAATLGRTVSASRRPE